MEVWPAATEQEMWQVQDHYGTHAVLIYMQEPQKSYSNNGG